MGRPDIARIKRDAEVAAAEADRDIAIKRAEASTRIGDCKGASRPGARGGGKPLRWRSRRKPSATMDIKKANYLETQ